VLIGTLVALILVPFALFETPSTDFSNRVLAAARSRATASLVIGGLLAADVLLPVPSSVVSTAAGTLLGFVWGTIASASGMTAGCVLGYWIGRRFGRAGAVKLVGPKELARAETTLAGFREIALIACRPVPVLAEASVVAAGTLRVPFIRFLAIVTSINVAISAWYASIGSVATDARTFVAAFLVAALLPAIGLLGRAMWVRRRRDTP
jgi:uncharacterized membrane protein YdjX (TVP38/TMEM64 family)